MKEYSLRELVDIVNGKLTTADNWVVTGLSRIDHPEEHTITYLSHGRYKKHLGAQLKRAVLVKDMPTQLYDNEIYIEVADPHLAICQIAELYATTRNQPTQISPTAIIEQSVEIHSSVKIGYHAVIKSDTKIAANSIIYDQVYIGVNCKIGAHTVIHPGVKILDGTIIGDHVVIYPNTVIGADGFGYRFENGQYIKIPHAGHVVIEDHVEIGANTCIDRAAIGSTIIREGTKLDNLIQVAHGVDIGKHTVMAAQAGISGSTTIGQYVQVGGQTGIAGHISIADGSKIQGQSGVSSNIKPKGQKWYGYPAIQYWDYLRSFSLFKRLPQLFARIEALEEKVK